VDATELDLDAVEHVLLVFGGVRGLEAAVEADDNFEDTDPEPLFDVYLNTCPKQGSRTIRTEEAVWVSLAALRPLLKRSQ
jgi:predicted SPOUT superfamily RNA methylase MTH1